MNKKQRFMRAVQILAPKDRCVAPQVILHRAQLALKEETLPIKDALPLKASLQIKAAEYWLKLGEADQALRELEGLPSLIWNHRWPLKTRIAAIGALRERDEMAV